MAGGLLCQGKSAADECRHGCAACGYSFSVMAVIPGDAEAFGLYGVSGRFFYRIGVCAGHTGSIFKIESAGVVALAQVVRGFLVGLFAVSVGGFCPLG